MKKSWLYLKNQSDKYKLSKEILDKDKLNGIDCGWIEQMEPFIKEFSSEGETVLDPFAGFGTTLLACSELNRKSIGIELDSNRVQFIKERFENFSNLEKPILINCNSARTKLKNNSIELCLTNIPYYNIKKRELKDNNFYNIFDYNEYLNKMKEIFRELRRVIKKNRYIVIMVQNIQSKNGNLIPLAWDIANILKEFFILKEERIIVYDGKKRDKVEGIITDRSHEYVLIGLRKNNNINLEEYFRILKEMKKEIKYILIGSLGIKLLYPDTLDQNPEDCDIVIKNDILNIKKIITLLYKSGYKCFSWEDEIDKKFDYKLLKGRYYIRATKDNYIIDITYENEYFEFEKAFEKRVIKDEIVCANIEEIKTLLVARGNFNDKLLISRLNKK